MNVLNLREQCRSAPAGEPITAGTLTWTHSLADLPATVGVAGKGHDGGERITLDWLRSVGFLPDGEDGSRCYSASLFYGRNPEEVAAGSDTGRQLLIDDTGAAVIEEYDTGGKTLAMVSLPDLPTRGHVRRMAAALGVTLAEVVS